MHKREVFKDDNYFQMWLSVLQRQIDECKDDLESAREAGDERKLKEKIKNIFYLQFQYWILSYSAGEEIDTLKELFDEVLDSFLVYAQDSKVKEIDFGNLNQYVTFLWLVSIALLLEIPNEKFCEVVNKIH